MPPLDSRDVSAVLKRCLDASVLVRKQALEAVCALISHALGAGTTLVTVAQRGGWDVVQVLNSTLYSDIVDVLGH
jgi:hypothetical protein